MVNIQGVDFLVHLEQTSEQVLKNLLLTKRPEIQLPSVLITGQSRLCGVF
jgi:hypothetical protein